MSPAWVTAVTSFKYTPYELTPDELHNFTKEVPWAAVEYAASYLPQKTINYLLRKHPRITLKYASDILPLRTLKKLLKKYPRATLMYAGHLLPEKLIAPFLEKEPSIKITPQGVRRVKEKLPHKGTRKIEFALGVIDENRKGHKMSYEEAERYITSITLMNLEDITRVLNVEWVDVYFLSVDRKRGHSAWSILIRGVDHKNNNIIFWRKETNSPQAGQTFLYFEGRNPVKMTNMRDAIILAEDWITQAKKLITS